MKVLICTRSMNDELYKKAMEFVSLPYDKLQVKKKGSEKSYLKYLFDLDCDYVINLNEDCFITDNTALKSLLDYMDIEEYDYCGMPDGGVVKRRGWNPVAVNPFFNIFHISKINRKIDTDLNEQMDSNLIEKVPKKLFKYNFDISLKESYYGIMFWLAKNFHPLYLDANEDGKKTILLNHKAVPFCIHTWGSRRYNESEEVKKRIDDTYSKLMKGKNHVSY